MFTYKKYRYVLIQFLALLFSLAFSASGWAACPSGFTPVWNQPGATLPQATVGQFYSTQATAYFQMPTGTTLGNYYNCDGVLPPGLSISSAGTISGTPMAAWPPAPFTVCVRELPCNVIPQAGNQTYSINVVAPVFTITGSVAPSSFSAPGSITTSQALTYTFTTTPSQNTTMVSSQGIFRVGSTQISANNTQISAIVGNGRGTVSESLTVLPSIMQKALSMGSSKMTYSRSFTNGVNTVNTQVEIRITTEAAADFRITRMQLYFQNRQPIITIKRNDTTLKTYAEINYVGSGLLQGYWEVDGNFLSNVIQTITSGTTVTIGSPTPPMLPTFSSGSHMIRFVVTKPSQDIPFPEIRYYVAAEEPKPVEVKKLTPLSLLFPHNKGVISYAPITFLWTTREVGIAAYFLEFYLKDEVKPLFSAYTKNPNYSLPGTILKTFFSSGKIYTWKVKGFDTFNNVTAESTPFTFTMSE